MRPAENCTSTRLDSSYIVGTAGSDSIGRGETITQAHLSELGFWPPSNAKELFNGLMQAVPNTPEHPCSSRARPMVLPGIFYELWHGAVKGENGYIPLFIPWFMDPEYRSPAAQDFERTPDEIELADSLSSTTTSLSSAARRSRRTA
jgi:hypothetical protein